MSSEDPAKVRRTDAAKVLLAESSSRRNHLSTAIGVWNGLSITGTIAIWAFLLDLGDCPEVIATQLALAGGLSSVLLGFWRLEVRGIDAEIIRLYPSIYFSERSLFRPQLCTISTPRYLPPLGLKSAAGDVEFKKIDYNFFGARGHMKFDVGAVVLILTFAIVSLGYSCCYSPNSMPIPTALFLPLNVFGGRLVLRAVWKQKTICWPIPKGRSREAQEAIENARCELRNQEKLWRPPAWCELPYREPECS